MIQNKCDFVQFEKIYVLLNFFNFSRNLTTGMLNVYKRNLRTRYKNAFKLNLNPLRTAGEAVTVNGDTEFIWPELMNIDLDDIWFQQECYTLHYANDTFEK